MNANLIKACAHARTLTIQKVNPMTQGLANHIAGKLYGFTARQVALARNELKISYKHT